MKSIRCYCILLLAIASLGCDSKKGKRCNECDQVQKRIEIEIIDKVNENIGDENTLISVEDLKKIFKNEMINSFSISSNSIQSNMVDISFPQGLGYNDKCQEFRWLFSSWHE